VQLSAGRVERVEFHDSPAKRSVLPTNNYESINTKTNNRKRKRLTADDLRNELQAISLPQTWDRKLHKSGSRAIVVFVDRLSMESSLKAAKKAAKNSTKIVWGDGIEDRLPPLGPQRYQTHKLLQYPPKAELLRTVNDYMTIFSRFEEARDRETANKAQEPDEDGFITVSRGPKVNSVARDEEMKKLIEKRKERGKGLEDFYRFQMREKRKETQGELLRKFEEDKKKVEEMKKRRGKLRVSDHFVGFQCVCPFPLWALYILQDIYRMNLDTNLFPAARVK
jgi:hypothetical protein